MQKKIKLKEKTLQKFTLFTEADFSFLKTNIFTETKFQQTSLFTSSHPFDVHVSIHLGFVYFSSPNGQKKKHRI